MKDGAEKELDEEDHILFPPRFLGYSTKEKMWGQFSVDQTIDAPGKRPEMFEKELQLDDKYKDLIQALVNEHKGKAQENSSERIVVKDIVRDKGKGLVLLFHGWLTTYILTVDMSNLTRPTRSWKNGAQIVVILIRRSFLLTHILQLTAETIAEATGKPLFVVSIAEIGLNASKAETNLEQMFYLAGKWEAVLLV